VDADAVVLAGGQGTRLRPLTLTRPKPVVPLLNRPFVHYQLALLRRHGVEDAILSCSYQAGAIETLIGRRVFGVRLRYAVEREPLGTGGGIRNAATLLGVGSSGRGRDRRLIVMNGDALTDADLSSMLRFHEERRAGVTIGLAVVDDPRPYGLVVTDADGAVRRFVEKPSGGLTSAPHLVNAGIYILEPDVVQSIPADRPVSIERETFPALLAADVACFGFRLDGYWRDIGTADSYRQAQFDLLAGRVRTPLAPAGTQRGECWISSGARIDPGAELDGPSVVGNDVALARGAHVRPWSVVGARGRIGEGATVERAMLWEDVTVGAGAILKDCIVANHVQIGARASLAAGVVLEPGATVPDGTRLPP
jgi:NDP-sugar pyrophosphorylase family protein